MEFVEDRNRLNVAFTRAIKKLIVIGNGKSVINAGLLSHYLDYCRTNASYFQESFNEEGFEKKRQQVEERTKTAPIRKSEEPELWNKTLSEIQRTHPEIIRLSQFLLKNTDVANGQAAASTGIPFDKIINGRKLAESINRAWNYQI
jgi:ATP-dependent exoDNAse (exonuclease V) beta subunit